MTWSMGSVLYLHDMRDDVWQNLMMDSTYTFDMLQSDSNDRFEIFTSPSQLPMVLMTFVVLMLGL